MPKFENTERIIHEPFQETSKQMFELNVSSKTGVMAYWGVSNWKRVSNNTPNFRDARKRGGRLPMQNFFFASDKSLSWTGETYVGSANFPPTSEFGSFSHRFGASNRVLNTKLTLADPFSQSQKDDLDRVVRNKILLALKRQSVNLAQAYAEKQQTRNLIIKNAERMGWAAYYLTQGKFALAADALGVKARKRAQRRYNKARKAALKEESKLGQQERSLASGWLELQYGWLPLINDVYGACEFLADAQFAPDYGVVSASKTLTARFDDKELSSDYGGIRFDRKASAKYTVKYVLHYGTIVPAIHGLSSLGITNPALVAWELMPYSFVVDWFLPVGNWLSTFDATLGLQMTAGCKTTFSAFEGVVTASQDNVRFGASIYDTNLKQTSKRVTCQRDRLLDFPSPGLPVFKNPLSVTHMANALALLTSTFKKR